MSTDTLEAPPVLSRRGPKPRIVDTVEGPMTLQEIARRAGVSVHAIHRRIAYGWPMERLLLPHQRKAAKCDPDVAAMPVSRQRKWQIMRSREGRCSICAEPLGRYRHRCDSCQAKQGFVGGVRHMTEHESAKLVVQLHELPVGGSLVVPASQLRPCRAWFSLSPRLRAAGRRRVIELPNNDWLIVRIE